MGEKKTIRANIRKLPQRFKSTFRLFWPQGSCLLLGEMTEREREKILPVSWKHPLTNLNSNPSSYTMRYTPLGKKWALTTCCSSRENKCMTEPPSTLFKPWQQKLLCKVPVYCSPRNTISSGKFSALGPCGTAGWTRIITGNPNGQGWEVLAGGEGGGPFLRADWSAPAPVLLLYWFE